MDSAVNALGFILLVLAFVLFRGWVRGRRRRAYGRFQRAMNPPAAPTPCPHCRTPVTAGAAFCPRCGAAVPPPLPSTAPPPEHRRRKAIVYLVIAALAMLGLAALTSARRSHHGDTLPRPTPPGRPLR
jgi:hypothetical protein